MRTDATMLHPFDSRILSSQSRSLSCFRTATQKVIQNIYSKRVCTGSRGNGEAVLFQGPEGEAFNRAWGIREKISHHRLYLEHQGIDTNDVQVWKDELREYVHKYGMAEMKDVGLNWERALHISWIAANAELDSIAREDFHNVLSSFVKEKIHVDGGGRMSSRMSLSFLCVGKRLDASGRLVKSLISALEPDCSRFDRHNILMYLSILASSNVNDQRLVSILSKNIEQHGLLPTLNPIEYQNLLNNFARVQWTGSVKQKSVLIDRALRMRNNLENESIVSLVQIMTRMPQAGSKDIDAVSHLVTTSMKGFAMKELGLVAKQYAILYTRNDSSDASPISMLGMIAQQAAKCVDGADPKDVVRLMQAFQTAHLKPDTLLNVLDIWADKRLASMNAHGISLAMTHFARIGEASQRLLRTAVSVVESNLDQLVPSDASKLIWAFAHLEYYPGENLLGKCLDFLQSPSIVSELSDREMANLFWGLVKLGHHPSVKERLNIASSLYSHPGRVSGQSSALLLWSFASSHEAMHDISNDRCFDNTMYRLGLELCRDVLLVDSQSISMTSWSLGVLKVTHVDFAKSLNSLADEGRLHMFDPQHISNLLWGLAKSGSRPNDEFLREVVSVLSGNLSMYSPQEVFNVCWAFATLRFQAPSVAAETVTELRARGTEFEGLELSGIAWSLSRILDMQEDSDLGEKACRVLQLELCKHIDELELSQLAMAFVGIARLSSNNTFEVLNPQFMNDLLERMKDCLNQRYGTISSVNTILEGMVLIAPQVPKSIMKTIEHSISDFILESSRLWEVCDLCYYTCEVGMVSLATKLLDHIEQRVIQGEHVTPRASIMLLHTMAECNSYPAAILNLTTSKLSSMSPKYRISTKWLGVLAETLPKLADNAHIVLSFHPDWEDRLHALR